MKQYLTYDDVTIPPRMSTIRSRQNPDEINIRGKLTNYRNIEVPIISAPMDTVTGLDMALKMNELGAIGCTHRFMSLEEQVSLYKEFKTRTRKLEFRVDAATGMTAPSKMGNIIMSLGVTGDWFERFIELSKEGCSLFCLDVAHGHHILVKEALDKIKSGDYACQIIAGNIATAEAANDLINWGADCLRVGIGGGSVCETRIRTGIGVPMITCLREVCAVAHCYDIPVIADGGIRSSGDIAKALACGASTVMLGSMLAGTDETPGDLIDIENQTFKNYRGSASIESKLARGETNHIEGASTLVPSKGSVEKIIQSLKDGIYSSFSYTGSHNMEEFHRNAQLGQVTYAGSHEAHPHLLLK